ncbi:CRISPR-associated endonuclease Cas1 [Vibrio sp. F13]|uniref:CRISPR-associated endonuclease Cas1 n=2 Tax=unclassified Vibrio TaxID=2614977 RepID=UPI0010BDD7F2|nr:CRISPR-associated endonuclease Cas1 [Vibrio sp. F13]TKF38521.1 CRISPR-associated endonuclease Cas1 [Vibrio sp. F13]TKF56331.1 CRISPR-associated endonuclease Cas1 [Vibrio sp. F13]
MTLLVLDEKGYELSLCDGLLRCFHPELGQKVVPYSSINQIIVGKGVTISSDVILLLAEKGISLLVNGHRLHQHASLVPLSAPASDIKLRQFFVTSNCTIKRGLAERLVRIRCLRQKYTLKMLGLRCSSVWDDLLDQLNDTSNLMIAEAHISRLYWKAWENVEVFSELGFTGRVRRPPSDPINAILSLTSTLEDNLYCKALLSEGLDIGLGIHHVTGYRRQSLIYDVKEITRSEVELWVANLFLNRVLNNEHFVNDKNSCRLNKQGQQVFYRQWHRFCVEHRMQVNRVARLTRKQIDREYRNGKATMVD